MRQGGRNHAAWQVRADQARIRDQAQQEFVGEAVTTGVQVEKDEVIGRDHGRSRAGDEVPPTGGWPETWSMLLLCQNRGLMGHPGRFTPCENLGYANARGAR